MWRPPLSVALERFDRIPEAPACSTEREYIHGVKAGLWLPRPSPLGIVGEGESSKVRRWFGLSLHIENPAGSIRLWPGGSTNMLYDYGEIRRTEGDDGDPVDVYVGPKPATAKQVYVVYQLAAPDFLVYDEVKCFIGFESDLDAKVAYEAHYDNPAFFGGMDAFDVGTFVQHIKDTGRCPGTPPVTMWNLWESVKPLLGTQEVP